MPFDLEVVITQDSTTSMSAELVERKTTSLLPSCFGGCSRMPLVRPERVGTTIVITSEDLELLP
jgi:hypothetical protein